METVYFLLEVVIKNLVVVTCLMLFVAYLTLAERKFLGFLQVRLGPNRVGYWGLLQPIADGIKSFVKEDIIPTNADKPIYVIAPMISFITALAMFAVIPFGDSVRLFGREIKLVIADVDIGILYVFAMATLGEYGIVLGGWASGNKYGILGALRATAQMISYEVALGLIIIGTIILAGSLRLTDIVEAQRGG
jgi:NADH-quinone oxidoreductase subunit H